jgi:ring-1,2-phenylacetyl-CoA epoxidase subunit PaaC
VTPAGSSLSDVAVGGHAAYVLGLGDDALVLAQRCGEWIAAAPQIEEDIALANIGLDLLGHARLLLSRAAALEGEGRDEDDLAYFRDAGEFRNLALCELPNGDFAVTMARLLVLSSYQFELYGQLRDSADATLAGIAAKAVKEVSYHRDHATQWVLRLGGGTPESAARMKAGLDAVWPYLPELFDDAWLPEGLLDAGIAVRPSRLEPGARRYLDHVLAEADLPAPPFASPAGPAGGGGRQGLHTEHLTTLLAELQSVARAHPGVSW